MLWRYIDLSKYTFILQEKKLHCPRGDKFEDKFEGSYPLKNVNDFNGCGFHGEEWKKYVYISCWHKSEYESDAMWRLYGLSKNGVALVTSKNKLETVGSKYGYYIKEIEYIDFINKKANILVPTDVFHYKRLAFIHESEIRLIKTRYPHNGTENGFPKLSVPVNGKELSAEGNYIDIDLDNFFDKIIVSPYSEKWFFNVVINLTEKYGVDKSLVHKSELSCDPIYSE